MRGKRVLVCALLDVQVHITLRERDTDAGCIEALFHFLDDIPIHVPVVGRRGRDLRLVVG